MSEVTTTSYVISAVAVAISAAIGFVSGLVELFKILPPFILSIYANVVLIT